MHARLRRQARDRQRHRRGPRDAVGDHAPRPRGLLQGHRAVARGGRARPGALRASDGCHCDRAVARHERHESRRLIMWGSKKAEMPSRESTLPGRAAKMGVPGAHFVNKAPLEPPFPARLELAMFGLGCFWGAERKFWQLPGVFSTSAGYAAGFTPNATYEEVCSGRTGHNEVVRVVFDPAQVSYETLLKTFWESHDPTQGMRQGNDVG